MGPSVEWKAPSCSMFYGGSVNINVGFEHARALTFSQGLPGEDLLVFPVINCDLAVYDDVGYTLGVLVGILECRLVDYLVRVEGGDIGVHPRAEEATAKHTEARR